jgi:hypothetical protein
MSKIIRIHVFIDTDSLVSQIAAANYTELSNI